MNQFMIQSTVWNVGAIITLALNSFWAYIFCIIISIAYFVLGVYEEKDNRRKNE